MKVTWAWSPINDKLSINRITRRDNDKNQNGGTYYVSSCVVKARARREDHVIFCNYMRQEVAQ